MVQKESVRKGRYENWRETTIVEHANLVKRMDARFAMKVPKSVLLGELVSAGPLGLIDAVDKFDPNKHVSFKIYAQYRIKGAILDELRSMDTYSRSMRKKIQDIAKAVKKGVKSKDNPSDKYDKEEIKAVFVKAIKKLSKKQQMVISLHYYDELTLKEIGEVLSLTESRRTSTRGDTRRNTHRARSGYGRRKERRRH